MLDSEQQDSGAEHKLILTLKAANEPLTLKTRQLLSGTTMLNALIH